MIRYINISIVHCKSTIEGYNSIKLFIPEVRVQKSGNVEPWRVKVS